MYTVCVRIYVHVNSTFVNACVTRACVISSPLPLQLLPQSGGGCWLASSPARCLYRSTVVSPGECASTVWCLRTVSICDVSYCCMGCHRYLRFCWCVIYVFFCEELCECVKQYSYDESVSVY